MADHRALDDVANRGEGQQHTGRIQQRASGVGANSRMADQHVSLSEDSYWREAFSSRPYAREGARYEDLQPAYRFGWEKCARYGGGSFEASAPALEREWRNQRPAPKMNWDAARGPVRDAWDRMSKSLPGKQEPKRH